MPGHSMRAAAINHLTNQPRTARPRQRSTTHRQDGWQHPPGHHRDRGTQPCPPCRATNPKHHSSGPTRKVRGYAPHPLSTVRIFSLLTADGEPRILGAFLRLGNATAMTDNLRAGGIAVSVDKATGVLGHGIRPYAGGYAQAASSNWHDPIFRHPDGTEDFTGRCLPHWDEAISTCKRAARLFPAVRLVGCDVMITDTGPVVIEGNHNIRLRTLQVLDGGLLDSSLRSELEKLGMHMPSQLPRLLPSVTTRVVSRARRRARRLRFRSVLGM